MNNIKTNLMALLIVLIVIFSIGRVVLLADSQKQLEQAEIELEEHLSRGQIIEAGLENMKELIKNEDAPIRNNKLILPGQEASLLGSMLELGGKSLRLNSYAMLPSFRVKPAEEEYTAASAPEISETLPQLDDQGMPVGLPTEDDEEWTGVEIIPVKMTFTSTYRSFGKFLSNTSKTMPVNAIRSMDLLLKSEGIVKGTLIMNFPVAENIN